MQPAIPPALVLVVAVLAMSWAGPLIKFSSAPAPVVSAWRLVFSVAFIAIVLLVRRRDTSWQRLTKSEWLFASGAGIMLALHFWTWIASLRFTTVASSVVLVDMQPIFVAVLSGTLLKERATNRQWLGIAIACVGAVVVGLADAHGAAGFSQRALLGDGLALAGAVFVSIYYVIGRSLRQKLDLWVYIGIVYGIAALVLVLIVALDPNAKLTGYPSRDWLIFAALAAGPMMLGHTGVNYALRYVRAYVANIALLGEPVGATLIAWLLPQLHEVPPPLVLGGAVLIGAGILLTVTRKHG
ncbi:MAG TPA: DMT family transporter [Longimicrobiales bacterium]|nr:DMT family transporter [Longimicrobiales bacterium]